ncbi:hypothetical protein SDC9_71852 [bioreactor metagenome]|uniref:Uncharacterized protein n=1 Tax=bioreactor metagenome TaxID=1076179 RepID=A0A644YBT0_9ZZZZ
MSGYPYSDPKFKELYSLGLADASHAEIVTSYLDWVKKNEYTFLQHRDTKEIIFMQNVKRGNDAYVRKKIPQFDEVGRLLSSGNFSSPAKPKWGRGNTKYANTMALFVTFSYGTGSYSRVDAWRSVTSTVNRWSAFARKYLGIGFSRMLISESNKNGYPAPHAILLLDAPLLVFQHRGKDGVYRWRIQDRKVVDDLHDAWTRATGGSFVVDIQGIVSGALENVDVSDYISKSLGVAKYISKSLDLASSSIAVLTHAYQKFVNKRDYISPEFWERLGRNNSSILSRLDTTNNELKPIKKIIRKIDRALVRYHGVAMWIAYAIPQYRRLRKARAYYERSMALIKARRPPPKWEYLDSMGWTTQAQLQVFMDRLQEISEHNAAILLRDELASYS